MTTEERGGVLLVEDDPTLAEVLIAYLERDGFRVRWEDDGARGLAAALADDPDLVVLDLMLPSLDGLEICRRLRGVAPVPVIMLTARGDEEDRIVGLELGADDYLAKPVSPRELVARVRAVLRRFQEPRVLRPAARILESGDLRVDAPARVVTIAGMTPVAISKGVRLEGRIDGSGTDLTGSAPELMRALRNILENAVRHTPADGAVVVEVGREGNDAYVSVADSGGGVQDDAPPRIFEVGFRGDPARSPGGGGGLGLAIARSFVEAHRGRITVRHDEVGACFTVWLPIDPGH